MNLIERIKKLKECEKLTTDDLSAKTGIGATRWGNVLANKAKIRHEEIEAIGKAFPHYKLWIAFEEEIPEAGQVSPMTRLGSADADEYHAPNPAR